MKHFDSVKEYSVGDRVVIRDIYPNPRPYRNCVCTVFAKANSAEGKIYQLTLGDVIVNHWFSATEINTVTSFSPEERVREQEIARKKKQRI